VTTLSAWVIIVLSGLVFLTVITVLVLSVTSRGDSSSSND